MFVRKLATFLVCLLGFFGGTAIAQSEARIRAVVTSIDEIENDLKWLIELNSDPNLRKQWKVLKEDVLDAFTQGVNLSKPVSVDIVFRKDELTYELRIPIFVFAGKGGFLDGLTGMGFKVTPIVEKVYYKFAEKGKSPFYLRYENGYGWISKSPINSVPAEAVQDLQPLLDLKKDVLASLKNDAAGLGERRENFKKLRQQFEALIKLRRDEDPNAFELRKLALIQQLDEAERHVVESDELLASWTTSHDEAKAFGRGEISLTALPGTDLAKSIDEIASKPSDFANVVLHENPIAQGRVTFPLDAPRVAHIKTFYKTVRPVLESEISKLSGLSDAQKTAYKQASSKFIDMLDSGLSLGVLDLFADGYAVDKDKNVLICGIKAADGTVADDIVKLLPQMDSEWKVNPGVTKHGGVVIHEITVPKSMLAAFQKIFAGETVIYIGTSKTAVWGAAGLDAVKVLSAAIDQSEGTAPNQVDPVFLKYQIKLDQLVNLSDLVQKASPKKNDAAASKDAKAVREQRQRDKDVEKFRKMAQDSMGGCNSLVHGELKKTGEKIEGHVELSECVLRFIGAIIADGAKTFQ